jgi:hypothetical protein
VLEPSEILEAARAKWPAVLRGEAAGEVLFPLRIPFGKPRPSDDFRVLRREIAALANTPAAWHIEWDEVRTRKWGAQRLPTRITFACAEDLAETLRRSEELRRFRDALQFAREKCPKLEPWLRAKAHRIPEYLDEWSGLISVCAFFDANPEPRCFARQIPVVMNTKFIEEHTGILRELLDVVLGDRVNGNSENFAERFHLLIDPPQVRFRFLDEALRSAIGWPVSDCSVPAPVFAALEWKVPRVLIVENRDVFASLPQISSTLAVFGSGKAASLFPRCRWMGSADLFYWGDCDDAGYGILSTLRAHFPRLRSVLMDELTWISWRHLAVPGKRDATAQHDHLDASERRALKSVLAGPWMLEQERIPAREAERALSTILLSNVDSAIPAKNIQPQTT